ncbi:hypothetical protein BO224_01210 [Erysipelotrichaceae bacterium NYU-BL-E8]|uniref:Uncharacterized protein n=1 Tax=Ileibacterium valens TaxID=1862668 RepID=A0A1U7NFA7_9FIRM|nr:hypothetical protein BO222_07730 [Ileibacterium valens]OLU42427.1 hypothetical protein BM735_02365 [Erysipelotrichaceae bacterium NYU-BL-F16]OLU42839.1 hypothetical protein BO224_01210 [Erysipelotrichaceae bacterium NYU-BL-E8]
MSLHDLRLPFFYSDQDQRKTLRNFFSFISSFSACSVYHGFSSSFTVKLLIYVQESYKDRMESEPAKKE